MIYESAPSTPSDIDPAQLDPVAWRLLHQLDATTTAVTAMAYHLRILTHLLAVADHRHLDAYATDLISAVDAHNETRGELDQELDAATRAWGLPSGSSLGDVVDSAPAAVLDALRASLGRLRDVAEELRHDGATANALAEAAVGIVDQRVASTERGSAGTYRAE